MGEFINLGKKPIELNLEKANYTGKVYGYPIGHVTTRSDGTKWRKIGPAEWEQVLTEKEKAAIAAKEATTFKQGDLVHFKNVHGNMDIGRIKSPHGDRQVFIWNDRNRMIANIANDKVTKITDPVLLEKYKDKYPVVTEKEKQEEKRNKELDDIITKLTPVQIRLILQMAGPKGNDGEPVEYGSLNSYTLQHPSLKSGLSQDTFFKLAIDLKLFEKIKEPYTGYQNDKYTLSSLGKEVEARLRGSRGIGYYSSLEDVKEAIAEWKELRALSTPLEERPASERGFAKTLRHNKFEIHSLKKDDKTTLTVPTLVDQFKGKEVDVIVLKNGDVITAPIVTQTIFHGEYGTARQLDMSDVDVIARAGKNETYYISPDNYPKLLNAVHYGTNFNFDKLSFDNYDDYVAYQKYGLTESDLRTSDGIRKPDIVFNPLDIGTEEYDKVVQEKLDKHNQFQKERLEKLGYTHVTYPTLIFPNYETAHLWLDELKGQITDGKYENTKMATENNGFLRSTIEVDKSFRTAEVLGGYWGSWKPNFNDLLWLFSKNHVNEINKRNNVRSVFSRVSNKKIKDYFAQIEPIFIK